MIDISHLDHKQQAKMVDVSNKVPSHRIARARAILQLSEELVEYLEKNNLVKDKLVTVAKIAGINAAKKTSDLIPLCHPLFLDKVDLNFSYHNNQLRIQAEVSCYAKTGVEMEALTAVAVAALTIYDMCKSVDKKIIIVKQGLYSKKGGKSGDFINADLDWENN